MQAKYVEAFHTLSPVHGLCGRVASSRTELLYVAAFSPCCAARSFVLGLTLKAASRLTDLLNVAANYSVECDRCSIKGRPGA
jgi:hypothetical protein